MAGTVRQGGSRLRLAVQLVDRGSGAHLGAENFERSFKSVGILGATDVPKMELGVGNVPGISFPELKQAPSKLKCQHAKTTPASGCSRQ